MAPEAPAKQWSSAHPCTSTFHLPTQGDRCRTTTQLSTTSGSQQTQPLKFKVLFPVCAHHHINYWEITFSYCVLTCNNNAWIFNGVQGIRWRAADFSEGVHTSTVQSFHREDAKQEHRYPRRLISWHSHNYFRFLLCDKVNFLSMPQAAPQNKTVLSAGWDRHPKTSRFSVLRLPWPAPAGQLGGGQSFYCLRQTLYFTLVFTAAWSS